MGPSRNRVITALLISAAVLTASAPATAGHIDPYLAASMARSGQAQVPVIVTLRESAAHGLKVSTLARNPGLNYSSLLAEYKAGFEESSQSALAFVQNRKATAVKPLWIVNGFAAKVSPDMVAALAARPDVKAVYADAKVMLERSIPAQMPKADRMVLDGVGPKDGVTWTYGLQKVHANDARSVYKLTGQGVIVAHIDTGVDATHPDLAGKILKFKDFVNNKPDPYDDQGHGTHTAGTIAGGATSGLAIGVAPDVKLVCAKVFTSSGSADTNGLLQAMEWVCNPAGDGSIHPSLCSNSWGGGPGETVFEDAVKKWVQLGIFPCFAAGNSGPDASTVGTPGGFLEAFAVGATDKDDNIADFSSRGPVTWDGKQYVKPDVSAPGVDVTSAKPGGGYQSMSGTSMATPHTAGVLALLYQANPAMTIAQAEDLLMRTADHLGDPDKNNTFGAGRINALSAAQILVSGGKINGKLTSSADGSPIFGTVTVKENGITVRTDKQTGAFTFVLPAGSYTLSAKAFGFVDQASVSVQLGSQQQHDLAIKLDRAASGTLTGKVVSGESGESLAAKITVLDTPLDPVSTQSAGTYSVTLPAGHYKIAVAAFGFEVQGGVDVDVAAGVTTTHDFQLSHLPSILLVADDNKHGYDKFYKAALDAAGKKYSTLDTTAQQALVGPEFLSQYQVIVWFTGDEYSNTLTAADQTALKTFLDNGGSLFLTGQDIGYDIRASDFYTNELHAKWVADASSNKQVTGNGLSFSLDGGDGASNQRYPDRIDKNGPVDVMLSYGADQGPAALAGAAGKGRFVYFGFGFEGIDTAAHRGAVLTAVLKYLAPTVNERIARATLLAQIQAVRGGNWTPAASAFRGAIERDLGQMPVAQVSGIRDLLKSSGSRDLVRAANFRLLEQ